MTRFATISRQYSQQANWRSLHWMPTSTRTFWSVRLTSPVGRYADCPLRRLIESFLGAPIKAVVLMLGTPRFHRVAHQSTALSISHYQDPLSLLVVVQTVSSFLSLWTSPAASVEITAHLVGETVKMLWRFTEGSTVTTRHQATGISRSGLNLATRKQHHLHCDQQLSEMSRNGGIEK